MAKAVRWQIPFVSLNGTRYRLDIYDEGFIGTPVQLIGGPQPFVTEENKSEDFFAAVRSQSGNIQVYTQTAGGSLITMDDLLPENNLSRPVCLIDKDSRNSIVWQGFLACEAYTQDYKSIPQVLTLPVISVLEAMGSVEITLSQSHPFDLVIAHLATALKATQDKAGVTLFDDLYITEYCRVPILSAYMYNNTYFSEQDVVSGDNVSVDVHSMSCKDILAQVAQLFGCVWREDGQMLYLSDMYQTATFRVFSVDLLIRKYVNGERITIPIATSSLVTGNIANMTWRGDNQKRSVRQGAKRVVVSTALKDFEARMELQECPVGSLVTNPQARWSLYGEIHVNTAETFYSLAWHRHMRVGASFPADHSAAATLSHQQNMNPICYDHTLYWEDNDFRTWYYELVAPAGTKYSTTPINYYVTSFMAFLRGEDGELHSGLMICGVPKRLYYAAVPVQSRAWNKFALNANNYLFKQTTPLTFSASQGYLRLTLSVLQFRDSNGNVAHGYVYNDFMPSLTVAVQFGDKWLYYNQQGDNYLWGDTFATFDYYIKADGSPKGNWHENMDIDETSGLLFRIPSFMAGKLTVYIYHEVDALVNINETESVAAFDAFVSELSMDYLPPKMELNTDRSSNAYVKETGADFRNDVTTQLSLATNANNKKLATMLWNDATTPARLLTIGSGQQRPEVALLDKMAEYYSQGRQQLKLEVAHPTDAPLPRLVLNGIGDGKKYLPLAESREWADDKSTLTCFETVNE
ncbi:MAG: hypothetical protein IKJ18_00680 [Bacteroidaceae bacterium]|nr:hypothetical protein [Bacteroidaceae bacterium]